MEQGEVTSTEFAIVGAGPAGLSAAIEAAKYGVDVTVVDENARPGGQLFKQLHKFFGSQEHQAGVRGIDIARQLLEETQKLSVPIMLNTPVWGIFENSILALSDKDGGDRLKAEKILLATGASEKALAFPGWTLPGVLGAGAAQTMMNIHRVLPGKRVLMVGSGNVGLIVAYQLRQAGAEVVAVVEAAPRIGGYGVHAAKIRRLGIPILTSHTIKWVEGKISVEGATVVQVDSNWRGIPGTEKHFDVDTVCLAVGLTPASELAWMCGCRFTYIPELGGHVPLHDENMETTAEGIYVAGDSAGIEEASTAMEEGKLAGTAVAESLGRLPAERAMEARADIRRRLQALRKGPFGREESKEELLRRRYM